jgi:hypothetical protein
VTIEADELPWPIHFYFLQDVDEQGSRWVNVSFEMGIGSVTPDPTATLEADSVIVAPAHVRWMTENFFRYRRLAEDALFLEREEVARTWAAIRRDRVRERVWTDDRLRVLVNERRSWGDTRGAIDALADAYGVDRTTIWRALKKAKSRGLS